MLILIGNRHDCKLMHRIFQLLLSARLAWKDLKSEPVLSLCFVLGIVAVLAPLIVIVGLRNGVLTSVRQTLLGDPHVREIVNVSNRSFSEPLLNQLALRKDVEILIPRTRTLASSLFLEKESDKGSGGRHVMLVPTMHKDPLLRNLGVSISQNDQVILSSTAASYLHIQKGDQVTAYLERFIHDTKEQVRFSLTVIAVVPQAITDKESAFVSLPLAIAVENYQDGVQDWPQRLGDLRIPGKMVYSGFRLYAKQLVDVPDLDHDLRAMGIDIVSRAGDVSGLISLNHRLKILFILVALLGGGGLCISLGAGLWANTERKRKILALLRFSGFSTADLVFFPVTQGFVLTTAGITLSFGMAIGAGELINYLFKDILPQGHVLFLLNGWLVFETVCLTLGGGLVVSLLSGGKSARIQPWEGVTAL